MTTTIGEAAARVANPDQETDSSTPVATQPWAGTLPVNLSDEKMTELALIANQPSSALPPVERDDFAKIMHSMAAVLPKRNMDDATGQAMLAVYYRMIGDNPRPAIAYLAQQAINTCKWFPTVAECKELLAGWKAPPPPQPAARKAIADEMQARLDRDMDCLKAGSVSQETIDGWPRRWRQVGWTLGYLDADGHLRVFKEPAL